MVLEPTEWLIAAFLVASNVAIHRRGGGEAALILLSVAWQMTVVQVARGIYLILTSITHQGGDEIVRYITAGSMMLVIPSTVLTVPVLAFAWTREFRKALWKLRWLIESCLIVLLDGLLLLLATCWIVLSHNREGYWWWP